MTDPIRYVSVDAHASDLNNGLRSFTAHATIAHALSDLGYITGAYFSYAVAVANGSTSITFAAAQSIPAGTPITFSSQPGVFYALAAPVFGTTGILATAYTGTTNAATMIKPGVGNPGHIQLLGGDFVTPVGGLALGPRQSIEGIGSTASKIIGSTSTSGDGNAVLTLNGSRAFARNLWIVGMAANSTCLRLEVTGTGTNESSIVENIYAENQGSGDCTAFAFGDLSSGDISDCTVINCTSAGAFNGHGTHMTFGVGTGNTLDITVIGGTSAGNNYGVIINGGSAVFIGLNFAFSTTADIWLHRSPIGNVSFRGGRSENSGRFIINEFWTVGGTVSISDYTVVALRNTDGKGIVLTGGMIALNNILLAGLTCPQYIFNHTSVDTDSPQQVDISNLASEHPFPLGSPWIRDNQIITTRGFRFCGDADLQCRARATTSNYRAKRKNITSDNQLYTLNSIFCDSFDVKLSANAGPFDLLPGALGKVVTIAFEQDGVGGHSYTWPVRCGFSGGSSPVNVTTSRNRQSCDFRWTGRYWAQCSAVTNIVPPAVASNPITDNFSIGNPYWLDVPDTLGTATRWEHVPGGGSLGISGGRCITPCLGYLGDDGTDALGLPGTAGLFRQFAAGAVIETGMPTQATGISATFTWQSAEGIVCHYLDDQTFFYVVLESSGGNGSLGASGFANGILQAFGLHSVPNPTVGSAHTLIVQCTSTGLVVTLDGGMPWVITFNETFQALFNDLTKHGIISTSRSATFTAFSVT